MKEYPRDVPGSSGSKYSQEAGLQQTSIFTAVNLLLVVVITLFYFQLLSELIFASRGRFCSTCGLADLPKNLQRCPHCDLILSDHEDRVTRNERVLCFAVPATSFLFVFLNHLFGDAGTSYHVVVLLYVVFNAAFAIGWLPGRDPRLRRMFNLTFWLVTGFLMAVLAFWMVSRQVLQSAAVRSGGAVVDLEIGPGGDPIIALRDGGLIRGVGAAAQPLFRDKVVRRLLRVGGGEVLVYIDSNRYEEPDALVGPEGLVWKPPKTRVVEGLSRLVGTTEITEEHRAVMDRAIHQRNVNFCHTENQVWFVDGYRLMRSSYDGKLSSLSLSRKRLDRLLMVSCDPSSLWLLSPLGLGRVNVVTLRKQFYPLAEFAARETGETAEIVAGSRVQQRVVFATRDGDVLEFDAERQRLSYLGVAECPIYLDYYNIYTFPVILVLLLVMLKARRRKKKGRKQN